MAYVRTPMNQTIIHVVDDTGKHATSQYYTLPGDVDPTAGGPLALANGVGGMTEGHVRSVEVLIHAINTAPNTPNTGAFDRVTDKMQLVFRAADGSTPILQLPAPASGILASDGVHVDPTNAQIIAIVAAMVTNGRTAEGGAITGLQRGFRRRPPRLKKQ